AFCLLPFVFTGAPGFAVAAQAVEDRLQGGLLACDLGSAAVTRHVDRLTNEDCGACEGFGDLQAIPARQLPVTPQHDVEGQDGLARVPRQRDSAGLGDVDRAARPVNREAYVHAVQ